MKSKENRYLLINSSSRRSLNEPLSRGTGRLWLALVASLLLVNLALVHDHVPADEHADTCLVCELIDANPPAAAALSSAPNKHSAITEFSTAGKTWIRSNPVTQPRVRGPPDSQHL